MADKERITKRERKEEAKRRRMEELKRRQRRAQMRKIYTIGISAAVIAGLVAVILVARANSGKVAKEINAVATTAGCDPLNNPKVEAGSHISPPQTGTYNTNPPTSGQHYFAAGIGPVATGIHTTEVANEGFVHNLEHGHIVILYKQGLDASLLNALTQEVKGDPNWMLISPRTDMPYQLAFVAWGHLEGCKSPNAKAVDVLKIFHDSFKNKGPEHAAGTPQGIT
jgi:uncharacterized protein DUF3105